MNANPQRPCNCATCPGTGCACGCQQPTTPAAGSCGTSCSCSPQCACGAQCRCTPGATCAPA